MGPGYYGVRREFGFGRKSRVLAGVGIIPYLDILHFQRIDQSRRGDTTAFPDSQGKLLCQLVLIGLFLGRRMSRYTPRAGSCFPSPSLLKRLVKAVIIIDSVRYRSHVIISQSQSFLAAGFAKWQSAILQDDREELLSDEPRNKQLGGGGLASLPAYPLLCQR